MVGKKTTLILQRTTETLDTMQSVIDTWQALRKIKGVLVTKTQRAESFLYDKETTVATHSFFIGRQKGITISTKDRFLQDKGTVIYEILHAPIPVGRGNHMEIELIERT